MRRVVVDVESAVDSKSMLRTLNAWRELYVLKSSNMPLLHYIAIVPPSLNTDCLQVCPHVISWYIMCYCAPRIVCEYMIFCSAEYTGIAYAYDVLLFDSVWYLTFLNIQVLKYSETCRVCGYRNQILCFVNHWCRRRLSVWKDASVIEFALRDGSLHANGRNVVIDVLNLPGLCRFIRRQIC